MTPKRYTQEIWLYDSLSSPPVAGVCWAHWRHCPVAAVASSSWMLHTGGGWGKTPHMIVKRFGCIAIHNKVLYKCIIHTKWDLHTHTYTGMKIGVCFVCPAYRHQPSCWTSGLFMFLLYDSKQCVFLNYLIFKKKTRFNNCQRVFLWVSERHGEVGNQSTWYYHRWLIFFSNWKGRGSLLPKQTWRNKHSHKRTGMGIDGRCGVHST